MQRFSVRVWLPDRPGALGQVASRIGAVRGDVAWVEILERQNGRAIDELIVEVPPSTTAELLAHEISQVDGVGIEEIRQVEGAIVDPMTAPLEAVAQLVETHPDKRLDRMCAMMRDLFDADWTVAIDLSTRHAVTETGDVPTTGWLASFIGGASHLSTTDQLAAAPSDMAWGMLGGHDMAVVIGRKASFMSRERRQIAVMLRIAAGLIERPTA